jgi:hypothetical protein
MVLVITTEMSLRPLSCSGIARVIVSVVAKHQWGQFHLCPKDSQAHPIPRLTVLIGCSLGQQHGIVVDVNDQVAQVLHLGNGGGAAVVIRMFLASASQSPSHAISSSGAGAGAGVVAPPPR